MRGKSLLDRWREQAVSRFGQALVAEMARHGGPEAYCTLVGVKKPTMGTWVRNTSKPGPEAARRMAEVSPSLVPHLQERGCLDSTGSRNRGAHYQRRQAPVPIQATAQTTETARRQHAKALTEAERRALKLHREALIAKAAPKINRKARERKRDGWHGAGKLAHDHYNPCRQGTYLRVAERIGVDGANVAVHATYETED